MTVITTRITVTPEGAISAAAVLPPGEHVATITVAELPQPGPCKRFTMTGFPIDEGPWDDSISLRREDMYGDDGR